MPLVGFVYGGTIFGTWLFSFNKFIMNTFKKQLGYENLEEDALLKKEEKIKKNLNLFSFIVFVTMLILFLC